MPLWTNILQECCGIHIKLKTKKQNTFVQYSFSSKRSNNTNELNMLSNDMKCEIYSQNMTF